jgi:4-amino-4-deoxy-L-arabinose transferase-like glycosyltransferase
VETPPAHTDSAPSTALLAQWHNGLRIAHIAQSRSAATCELRGRMLGIAVVVLSTVVGTAIFSTLESSPSTAVKIVAGFASVGAGVLAALQTFLGFEQRAAKHREVAAAYGALRRELESASAFPSDGPQLAQLLADVRGRWDVLDASAPAPSPRIYRGAVASVKPIDVDARAPSAP